MQDLQDWYCHSLQEKYNPNAGSGNVTPLQGLFIEGNRQDCRHRQRTMTKPETWD